MGKNEFGVDKDKVQVFLFDCPCNLPLSFASHPWFVVNHYGVVSRYEVSFRQFKNAQHWGHLNKDVFLPFRGIEVISYFRPLLWKARLLGQAEGELAERMALVIENSPSTYPYCEKYSFAGPNSNTFAQWVLDQFPEFAALLPSNAFGKNHS